MAAEITRTSSREILRQAHALRLTTGAWRRRFTSAPGKFTASTATHSHGIDAAAVEAMTDAELTARLYRRHRRLAFAGADCAQLHLELRRRAVTLMPLRWCLAQAATGTAILGVL